MASIVGRYETSEVTTTAGTSIKVVAGEFPSNKINWYYMYAQQRAYASNNNLAVGSTMIQGAAYDQVLKFVNTEGYDITVTTNVGHGSSSAFTTTPYQTGGRDYSTNYKGTIPYNDTSKNIFDLCGNVNAWTTAAIDTTHRLVGGGYYGANDRSASNHGACGPYSEYGYNGSVSQLYIK